MQKVPLRSEIDEAYQWDLASIFPTAAAWQAELEALERELPELARFRGRLAEGPALVAECFECADALLRRVGKVQAYARLGYEGDTLDEAAAARVEGARAQLARAQSLLAYRDPELLAIGIATLRAWAQAEPRLAVYRFYFERLAREHEHVRSPEVETLLRQLSDPFNAVSQVATALTDTDLGFRPARSVAGETFEVAQGSFKVLIQHPDRELRRSAWESYADGYLSIRHGLARNLGVAVKQHAFMARARGYGSSFEAALGAKLVPEAVFHQLLAVFQRNLPTWHRYWRLRRKALGYAQLGVYDTHAPLTAQAPVIALDRAVDWIAEGMAPLGPEYVAVLRQGMQRDRWVDVYPNRGKRSGAFSGGSPGTLPFILMSYTDDLGSLSTLAHELGHSLHHYYSWQQQPFDYARAGSFLGEVASTFNQALVRAHLLRTQTDRNLQIALLEEALGNFHRYFFIMPTLARFEYEIHARVERGEGLTAQNLSALMLALFREGYGGEVELDEERVGIVWAQFPVHLYLNFYTWEYATGISAAHALAGRILDGEPGAREAYLEFLRAGSSDDPIEILKRAGVDMASPAPVERAFRTLAEYVERLERLLG